MKHLKKFKVFEKYEVEESEDIIYQSLEKNCLVSKKGIYLFQFGSFLTFSTFVEKNIVLFKNVRWGIHPHVQQSEKIFNSYHERFPIFCVIIDTNIKEIFGVSMNNDGKIGVCIDSTSRQISEYIIKSYLDKLNIEIEDLV